MFVKLVQLLLEKKKDRSTHQTVARFKEKTLSKRGDVNRSQKRKRKFGTLIVLIIPPNYVDCFSYLMRQFFP